MALLVLTPSGRSVDPLGIGFATAAALCWAGYIVLMKRVGRAFRGFEGLALSLAAAAAIAAPVDLAQAGGTAGPAEVAAAIGLGFVIPLVPYGLEMLALRSMGTRAFGVLMSADPAISALAGLVVLGQHLDLARACGVACVVVASVGTVATGRARA